ncbi:hypothetical protein [Pleurocapsa sp. PCC 7319]|uniref:hypothetical protein n=1 Tax=Pleurocapsa sp. PCC 7319 TaxID=118161 RepID=UPI0003772486|nr:hypothetical protein [Pleurocapsa sp. PCC 7319]
MFNKVDLLNRLKPYWFRGSSYLKIGWTWVKNALTQGCELFQTLFLNGKRDPEPAISFAGALRAIASRQHDEQKKYRLEFTVSQPVTLSLTSRSS